jgi:ribosome-associated translation inhibitor RaiA
VAEHTKAADGSVGHERYEGGPQRRAEHEHSQKAGNPHEALPGRDHTPADRAGAAPKKALFAARLTLRVPSNILRSEKSATDVIKAFDDAVKALLRELASLMADLRRETFWKRRERRKELHALKAAGILSQSQNWLSDSDRR